MTQPAASPIVRQPESHQTPQPSVADRLNDVLQELEKTNNDLGSLIDRQGKTIGKVCNDIEWLTRATLILGASTVTVSVALAIVYLQKRRLAVAKK